MVKPLKHTIKIISVSHWFPFLCTPVFEKQTPKVGSIMWLRRIALTENDKIKRSWNCNFRLFYPYCSVYSPYTVNTFVWRFWEVTTLICRRRPAYYCKHRKMSRRDYFYCFSLCYAKFKINITPTTLLVRFVAVVATALFLLVSYSLNYKAICFAN